MAEQWVNREEGLRRLLEGKAPDNQALMREVTVGADSLTDFLSEQYLKTYIPQGGSKIKFVTGRPGSGKTHIAQTLLAEAENQGFLTVSFSARTVWLHDFREIYLEILKHVDLDSLMEGCAQHVLRELIPNADERPEGMPIADFLISQRQLDVITRGELRDLIRKYFLNNPALDNNFGLCCAQLAGDILGLATCEEETKSFLLKWIHGDRTLKNVMLRSMGMAAYGITKYNARHMLRSLCWLVSFSGRPGILVCVDHLETVLNLSGLDEMKYTSARRTNTYEIIRQLIDDIDSMKNILFVFAFNRVLMDHEKIGLPSYSALWMRIQNEIVSPRFNAFTDIANLDKLAEQEYTAETLTEITRRAAELTPELMTLFPDVSAEALWRRNGLGGLIPTTVPSEWPREITREEAEKLIRDYTVYGSVGLVRQALRLAMGLKVLKEGNEAEEGEGGKTHA